MASRTVKFIVVLVVIANVLAFVSAEPGMEKDCNPQMCWTITDSNNETCSLMQMEASISHPIFDVEVTVPMEAETSVYETCPTDDVDFNLTWTAEGFKWHISLQFQVSSDSKTYTLLRYTGYAEGEDGSNRRDWDYTEYSYPTVAIKEHFACSLFVAIRARFENVRWQPFANLNDGEFGTGQECVKGLSGGTSFAIFIVAIIAIASAICVGMCAHPGRKTAVKE
ncbi:uncharacterized protein [Apostichopus japonicus]|uniref:uncharacterized protein n=1 Tax=Stichopus japonicus TaxID=307972 RepID=UPI003AB5B646